MIYIDNLCVSYGGKAVLENCTLQVGEGERVALTGPSGCGKTTLLGCIAKLVKPDSGDIRVLSRKISFVFQEPRLLPWLNAAQNINVVLSDSARTMPESMEMLELLGLSSAAQKYPHELSGGMRQRLSIGRSLAYDGDIFLLDEPLKGMDRALRDDVAFLINERTRGKTLVLVSHYENETALFTDLVYVYKDKRFEAVPEN